MTIYCFLKDGSKEAFKSHVLSIEAAAALISGLVTKIIALKGGDKIKCIEDFIQNNLESYQDVERNRNWLTALNFTLSLALSQKIFEKYLGFPKFEYIEKKNYLRINVKCFDNDNSPRRYVRVLAILSMHEVPPHHNLFKNKYRRKLCCLC